MGVFQKLDENRMGSLSEAIKEAYSRLTAHGAEIPLDASLIAALAARETNSGKMPPKKQLDTGYVGNIFQIGPSSRAKFLKNHGSKFGIDESNVTDPVNQVIMATQVARDLLNDAAKRGIDVNDRTNILGVWSFGPRGYSELLKGNAPSEKFLYKYHRQILRYLRKNKLKLNAENVLKALNDEAKYYEDPVTVLSKPDIPVADELGIETAAEKPVQLEPQDVVSQPVEPTISGMPQPEEPTSLAEKLAELDKSYFGPEPEKKIAEKEMTFSALRTGLGAGIGLLTGMAVGRIGMAARLARGLAGAALGATGSLGAQAAGMAAQKAGLPKEWAEVGSFLLEPVALRTTLGALSKIKAPQVLDEVLVQEKGYQDQFHELHNFMDDLALSKRIKGKVPKDSPLKVLADKNGYVTGDKAKMADPKYWNQVVEALSLPEELKLGLFKRMNIKLAPIFSSSEGLLRSLKFKPAEMLADTIAMKFNVKDKVLRDFLAPLNKIHERYANLNPVEREQVMHLLDSIIESSGEFRWDRLDRYKAAIEKLETKAVKLGQEGKPTTRIFNTLNYLKRKTNLLESIDRSGPLTQAGRELRLYANKMADYLEREGIYVVDDKGRIYKFKPRDFYAPRILRPDVSLAENELETLTKTYMDKFGVNRLTARTMIEEDLGLKGRPTYFAHAKRRLKRIPDLDVIITDPFEAFAYYTMGMAEAVSNFKAYGPGFYKVKQLIKLAKGYNKPELNNYLDHLLRDLEGKTGSSTEALNRIMANIRATMTALKLPLAVVPNLTQSHLTMSMAGIKNFGKAIYEVYKDPSRRQMLQEITPVLRSNVEQLLGDIGASGTTLPQRAAKFVLEKTGFSAVETKLNRALANATGWIELKDILRKIRKGTVLPSEIRRLRKAGIDLDELLNKGITKDMEFKFGNLLEQETQFGTRVTDIPLMWRTPTGKFVTQFKNFAFNHAKLIKNLLKDAAMDYWQTGNVRAFDPLLRLGYLMPTFGWVVLKFRDFVFNRKPDRTALDELLNSFAAAGGLGIVSDMITSATYGPGVLINSIVGPGISTAGELFSRTITTLGTGEVSKNLGKELKRISPVGKIAVSWLGKQGSGKLKLPTLSGKKYKLPKL